MTTKIFCNKCNQDCTGEKITLPDSLIRGYFTFYKILQGNKWTLCSDCINSFREDLTFFLKKQGYDDDDFEDFGINVRLYFDRMDKLQK